MMASPRSARPAALRPYLSADAPVLADIFQASIEELTGGDYSEAQRAAWAAAAEDAAEFDRRLADQLTLVAVRDGLPLGFASLKGGYEIDMLYVRPDAAGQGVGSLLCTALEKLAASRGATRLTADVSDTAQEFFRSHGFRPRQRNTVPLGGEWLASTTMEKPLAPSQGASA
jgi:putative acetyltransferase